MVHRNVVAASFNYAFRSDKYSDITDYPDASQKDKGMRPSERVVHFIPLIVIACMLFLWLSHKGKNLLWGVPTCDGGIARMRIL